MTEQFEGNGRYRKTDSKKFMVVFMAFVLMAYCLIAITVMAWCESKMMGEIISAMNLPLPILAGVFPLYLGANATQKVMTSRNGKEAKK